MREFKVKSNIGKKLAYALLWIALWQLAATAFGKSFVLPSPLLTFRVLADLAGQALFWHSCAVTLLRVSSALAAACAAGFLSAYFAWYAPRTKDFLHLPVSTIKTVPVMSVILFALLCMPSFAVPVFVCFLMCFPVMYTNILQGFESVPKGYLELAQVYRMSRGKYFSRILLPASKGYVKAGLELCAGLSWKSCVAAEVLSSPRTSMGFHLMTAKMYLDGASLFAWTLAIIALSLCFEKLLKALLGRL